LSSAEARSFGREQRRRLDVHAGEASAAHTASQLAGREWMVVRIALPAPPPHVPIGEPARHEPHSPHTDVRLSEHGEAVHRPESDVATQNQHALRLGERLVGVATMLERSDRDDPRERAIGEWKVFGIAANEIDLSPCELRPPARDNEPPHRHVDPNGTNAVLRDRTCQITGPRTDVEPRPRRSTTGRVEAVHPLSRSCPGVQDVMHEARRLFDGRSWRHGPIRTHHGLERRAARALLETPGLFAIVLEADPRIGLETEVGDSQNDRIVNAAALTVERVGLRGEIATTPRADHA